VQRNLPDSWGVAPGRAESNENIDMDQEVVDQRVIPTNCRRKIITIILFAIEGITLLAALPQGRKVTSVDFQEHILGELAV
jgi:hypothetical protein